MAQPNRLMDLLVDEDEENDAISTREAQDLENLLRSRTPTPGPPAGIGNGQIGQGAVVPQQSFRQQSASAASSSNAHRASPGLPPGSPIPQGVQQHLHSAAPPSNPQKPSSIGKFPFHLLLSWCKTNLAALEQPLKIAALEAVQAKYNNQASSTMKEIYQDIGQAIGTDTLNHFSSYFSKQLKARGVSTGNDSRQGAKHQQASQYKQQQQQQQQQAAKHQAQPQANQQAPQSAAMQHSTQSNASVMRSLLYNADQHRYQTSSPAMRPAQVPGATQEAAQRPHPASQPLGPPQPRPLQPWLGSSMAYRPSPQAQNPQAANGPSYPLAFTPSPVGQSAQHVTGNSAQATTQPQLMQTARRDVLQQASNSSARPPLAPTGPSSTPAGLLKHAADSALVGPAAKRPKRDKDDIDEENDIFKDTGVNLEEEQNALMGNVDQSHHARPLQQQTTETPFLNLSPLQIKVDEIARRHGLSSVDPQVYRLLSRALDAHFSTVIKQVFTMARQRTDADRRRPGMVMSNNLRKKLHDINMKEEAARKQKEAAKQQTADEATEKARAKRKREEDGQGKKDDKMAGKESQKRQASAANAAAVAAFGKTKWNKWGQAPKSSTKQGAAASAPPSPGPTSSQPPASGDSPAKKAGQETVKKVETAKREAASGLGASRANAEMMTAKLPDLIAVMEKDRMYQKSTLLYKLQAQIRD